jgi:signal transduction histidine kinase
MSMRSDDVLRIKQLIARLITAQEDERSRVARDLHDHFGQQLTALRLRLDAIAAKLPQNDSTRAELEQAARLAAEMDRDLGVLAWDLRPPALDDLGLAAALERLVRQWSDDHGIPVEFTASAHAERMDPLVETCLYRIAQEALHNVLKHARATRVVVSLTSNESGVELRVEDNGVGLSDDAGLAGDRHSPRAVHDQRLGLISMRERAALADGTFEMRSAPRKGVAILVTIPHRDSKGSTATL